MSQALRYVCLASFGLATVQAIRSPARAQPVGTDAVDTGRADLGVESATELGDREAARSAFERGEAAVQVEEYAEALRNFEEAFRAEPHDVVRFNIAVCLERLGRFREAAREYELAAASAALDDGQRSQARALAATMRYELGTVSVEGAPAGSPVAVDGEQRCLLPCRLELDPGDHEIALLHGANEQARVVSISRGRIVAVVFAASPSIPTQPESLEETLAASETLVDDSTRGTDEGSASRGVGWLTWTGASLAVLGMSGAIGFGLHARSLHEDYERMPTQSLRDEGVTMRTLTNASIGVGAVGALLVAIDLILLASQPGEP